jgi:hypothetical protein
MIRPISDEAKAVKAARPSALRLKLIKGLTLRVNSAGFALTAEGIRESAPKKETATRPKPAIFLRLAENLPSKGRINAPITGTKTIYKRICDWLIKREIPPAASSGGQHYLNLHSTLITL